MRTIFTNGCFDLLHIGHIRLLQFAKSLGTELIVGLNSDESIKRLKGVNRPFYDERTRKEMLCALGCVDRVILFEEDTPLGLIFSLRPDVIVKGADYSAVDVVGKEFAEIAIYDSQVDISTGKIIARIKAMA